MSTWLLFVEIVATPMLTVNKKDNAILQCFHTFLTWSCLYLLGCVIVRKTLLMRCLRDVKPNQRFTPCQPTHQWILCHIFHIFTAATSSSWLQLCSCNQLELSLITNNALEYDSLRGDRICPYWSRSRSTVCVTPTLTTSQTCCSLWMLCRRF